MIPPDIEYFPQEHVISLLRVVAAERDELFVALQNEQAKSAAAAPAFPTNDAFGFPYPAAEVPEQHNNQPPPMIPNMNSHNHHHNINNNNNINNGTNDNTMNMNNLHHPPNNSIGNTIHNSTMNSNVIPSTFKVDAVKKRIAKKSYTLVKKTPHSKSKKPYTEINEAVPNAACAMALFAGFESKSDTSRLTKWDLTGDQVVEWLRTTNGNAPVNKYIHPVKFDGKVISFGGGGSKPFVYAWAKYVSLQAKYDKKGGSLQLKFRTIMIGSGRPQKGSDSPPSFGV